MIGVPALDAVGASRQCDQLRAARARDRDHLTQPGCDVGGEDAALGVRDDRPAAVTDDTGVVQVDRGDRAGLQ